MRAIPGNALASWALCTLVGGKLSDLVTRRREETEGAMLGDYLTALLIAVLGYVYPAYLCFKVRLASHPPSQARPDVVRFLPPRRPPVSYTHLTLPTN